MKVVFNRNTFLWAIGVLQPVSAPEIRAYLAMVLDDAGSLPSTEEIQRFCLDQANQKRLVRVSRGPDLFSLSLLGSQSLPDALRKSRDKSRIYLLRDAYRSKIATPREVDAMGLDGASPSPDARSTIKGPEAKKPSLVVPRGQSYWPRFSKQLSEETGPQPTSRGDHLRYYSFSTFDQLVVAGFDKSRSMNLDVTALGLMIGISPKLIVQILRNPDRHYRAFELAKAGGGTRSIQSPRIFLKAIQRFLLDYFLFDIPTSDKVYSFRPGMSVADNARNHVGKAFVGCTDIVDFFGSIGRRRISIHLQANDFSVRSAELISSLVTYDGHLPQGAPTSPAISNAILIGFDSQITTVCMTCGLNYSRYADDITISGDDKQAIKRVMKSIAGILFRDYGLRVNEKKTRISSKFGQQRVTGLVVNEKALPPRSYRRRVRADFHNASVSDHISEEKVNSLAGHLSYLSGFEELKGSAELVRYKTTLSVVRGKLK